MARTHNKVRYLPKSKHPATTHAPKCSPQAAEEAFRLLEGRWKLAILYHLFGTPTVLRFSELERAIPAVTQKMLIQQLRELERDGIVVRTVHAQVPPKVEYGLTPVGLALRPTLHGLLEWAELRRHALSPTQEPV